MPEDTGVILSAIENLDTHQSEGFKAVHDRLDKLNDRVRTAEGGITRLEAITVNTTICERTREICRKARGASWRTYVVAAGAGITVALVAAALR